MTYEQVCESETGEVLKLFKTLWGNNFESNPDYYGEMPQEKRIKMCLTWAGFFTYMNQGKRQIKNLAGREK